MKIMENFSCGIKFIHHPIKGVTEAYEKRDKHNKKNMYMAVNGDCRGRLPGISGSCCNNRGDDRPGS